LVPAARDGGDHMSVAAQGARKQLPLLPLFFVALLSYFDWIGHKSIPFALAIGVAGSAGILFRPQLIRAFNLEQTLAQLPVLVRAVLPAIPALGLVVVRGQGTSGAGMQTILASIIIILVTVKFRSQIDARLGGWYAARNRVLPRPLRTALVAVVPILIGFLVVHGSLADIPALFGAVTKHAQSPSGRGNVILLGTLLSAAAGYLLAAGPAKAGAMQRGWSATHVIPAGGLPAWASPDPSAPPAFQMPPGTEVVVGDRAGDWAYVGAENGWTGWVDARQLVAKETR
jgi:hypothetical protein